MQNVNFRMDVNSREGKYYTISELARMLGVSEQGARKRLRSFIRFYKIPPERLWRQKNGVWCYALDEELAREFIRYSQPKIRIEVKLE